MNRPRIKRLLYGILKEMVDQHFNSAYLTPYMQLLREVGATAESTAVGMPGGWVDQRAALIRGWIQGTGLPQKRLEVTTNGGEPFTSEDAAVDLAGTAPVDVISLEVSRDGAAVPREAVFSGNDFFGWAVAGIPLRRGPNRLEAWGFDSAGNVVDSDAIVVFFEAEGPRFVRGDVDLNGAIDLSDVRRILGYLFQRQQIPCLDAADVDDTGKVNLADAIRLLGYLFQGVEAPPPPFPDAGVDGSDDGLDCASGF